MKKITSALALAAAMGLPVAAQADFSFSGYAAAGLAMYDYSDAAGLDDADEQLKIDDGRLSRFRFAGAEELGNGLTADYMFETRLFLDDDSLSTVGNGNKWVGLSGGFGKVMLGQIDTYYSDGILTELSRATSFGSLATLSLLTQVGGAYGVTPGRHYNQIRYVTPSFGGFKGTLAYSDASREADTDADGVVDSNEVDGTASGDTIYASGYYFQGPIYAGLSYINQEADDESSESTGTRLYGSYTFPFGLKVGLNWDRTEIEGGGASAERDAWFIPVTYKTGAHAVYFAYGQADDLDTNAGDLEDSGADFWNIGYDYALSNRTSVGVNVTELSNDEAGTYSLFLGGAFDQLGGNAAAAPGLDVRQIYAGIAHTF